MRSSEVRKKWTLEEKFVNEHTKKHLVIKKLIQSKINKNENTIVNKAKAMYKLKITPQASCPLLPINSQDFIPLMLKLKVSSATLISNKFKNSQNAHESSCSQTVSRVLFSTSTPQHR